MQLALDPTGKKPNGTNRYYVVGNGAPYELPGDQAAANAFARLLGIKTIQPSVKEWSAFLQACTPVTGAGGGGEPLDYVRAAVNVVDVLAARLSRA